MADQDLIAFQFETHTLSVLTDEHGDPWWIGAEVCTILEVKNVSDALNRLDADEKNTIVLNESGRGNPTTLIINESGLYTLVLSSRKKVAKKFKRWVTHDVLPQIRKTGQYTTTPTLPTLHDPAYQMLLQAVIDLDATRHVLAQVNAKADLALTQQQWITLRQYVFVNKLTRQLPPARMTEYGKWLTGYCVERNIPVSREPVADRPYDAENRYHVGTIEATLPGWLQRRDGQAALRILPGPEQN